MKRKTQKTWARLALAGFALAAVLVPAAASPARAAVTCPTVDLAGTVSPAPTPGVDWDGCDLASAILTDADLVGANLANATLTGDLMTRADLADADLAGAKLFNASGNPDLAGTDLNSAVLTDALFNGANLRGADLTDVSAFGVHLLAAGLTGATLTGADLTGGDLTQANLTGATGLASATVTGVTWTHAICPVGASADYYTGGCTGTVNVTTPAATPVVTAGTAGHNGWYTSKVTVQWNWIDANALPTGAACPASTVSSGQGAAVQVTATCTDAAGNKSTARFDLPIDLAPPTQQVTGVRAGGFYPYDRSPLPTCADTDAVSGVATWSIGSLYASNIPGTQTGDLAGVYTMTCSGATDKAGNKAGTVSAHWTVQYMFGGFTAPKVGSTLSHTAKTITVKTYLANEYGTAIPAAEQAARAKYHEIRATLAGPGIKAVTVACTWNTTGRYLQCAIAIPRGVKTGRTHPYTLTVAENLGSGWRTIPADAASENPAPIYFK